MAGEIRIDLAAYEDYLPAQLFLAEAYEKGLHGYEFDPVWASMWYEKAQKNGADVDDKIRQLEQLMSGPDI